MAGCAFLAPRKDLADLTGRLFPGANLHQFPCHQPYHMIQESVSVIIQYDQVISGSMNVNLCHGTHCALFHFQSAERSEVVASGQVLGTFFHPFHIKLLFVLPQEPSIDHIAHHAGADPVLIPL